MTRRTFKLSHSLAGIAALLIVEAAILYILSAAAGGVFVLLCAVFGSVVMLYAATEIIEEVQGARHMLSLLFAAAAEFVVFFAFEYWFLLRIYPKSFGALNADPLSLTLHSVMVFVFNPLYLPADALGQGLLLINTLAALGLVLFILQNIWQIRRNS